MHILLLFGLMLVNSLDWTVQVHTGLILHRLYVIKWIFIWSDSFLSINTFSESLDELTDMVVPLVSEVENKSLPYPEWNTHPYGPNELQVGLVKCMLHSF